MLCMSVAVSEGPRSAKPTINSCDDSRTVAVEGPVLIDVEMTTPGIGPSCSRGNPVLVLIVQSGDDYFMQLSIRIF